MSRYVARFGKGMLVNTVIYSLPFDKKLQEPLLHSILSSSTGDDFMIMLIWVIAPFNRVCTEFSRSFSLSLP